MTAAIQTMGCVAAPSLAASIAMAAEPVCPIKVSENHRYFVDENEQPVFWLGTTQWQLFRDYKLEDARTILEKTKQIGTGWPRAVARPGLPQTRTCAINAFGSCERSRGYVERPRKTTG